MKEKLDEAFIEGLGLNPKSIDWARIKYGQTPEWDSVAHMQLIAELEDTFDVMIETDEVLALNSYSAAKQILANHGIHFD